MPPDAPLIVSGWTFPEPPAGWERVPGAGLRRSEPGRFPSNVTVSSDELPPGRTLASYVESQLALMRFRLSETRFEGPWPATLAGTQEAVSLEVGHAVEGGLRVLQRQLYARLDQRVFIFTFTTDGTDAGDVEAAFDSIARGLSRAG